MELIEVAKRVPLEKYRSFCIGVLTEVGVPLDQAEILTNCLAETDLRGVFSHGIMRLPIYLHQLKKTKPACFNPVTELTIVMDEDAVALVDGNNGIGHVVCTKAMEIAIDKAKKFGIGAVGVRGSNHNGAEAIYTQMAVDHDMIGYSVAVSGNNIMAPWGGLTPLLGNNPFSFGIPAGEEYPIILDMACSVVARGWIIMAKQNGWKIPEGLAVDIDGNPTTDAQKAYDGLVLPVGGYKGSALTLIGSILGGVLTGANYGHMVTNMYKEYDRNQNIGNFMFAIDVGRFIPISTFKSLMDEYIRELKSSKLMPGVDQIYMPGEKEFLAKDENLVKGIPISPGVLEALNSVSPNYKL